VATYDDASAIHILVIIKDFSHLIYEELRPNVAAFDNQVKKNPEE
jgi:hypothetical protein